MVNIKFCGLKREEDILACNKIRPDYIGFVFWEKSSRNISFVRARELKALLDPSISAVGVFVDEKLDVVKSLLDEGTIDIA